MRYDNQHCHCFVEMINRLVTFILLSIDKSREIKLSIYLCLRLDVHF